MRLWMLPLALGSCLLLGCVDTSIGTILGALTYFRLDTDPSILVNKGWVALYTENEPDTVFLLQQTDELGRFNFEVEEGNYSAAGSLDQAGPFSGRTAVFGVVGHSTTRILFPIANPAPDAPIAGEVTPTGEVGATGQTATFTVTSMPKAERWSWSFGEGADPMISAEASPTVTLLEPGTYTGTVIVSNPSGTSAPRQFIYTVLAAEATS